MKKALSVLCILLLLFPLTTFGQRAMFVEEHIGDTAFLSSLAVKDNTLYALTTRGIWRDDGQIGQYVSLDDGGFGYALITGAGSLYLLDVYAGALRKLNESFSVIQEVTLDYSDLTEGDSDLLPWTQVPRTVCVVGDNLCYLTKDGLYLFDLTTGARRDVEASNLMWICAGESGSILALWFDGQNPYDQQKQRLRPVEVRRFYPLEDKWETICEVETDLEQMPDRYVCDYEEADNVLYIAAQDRLYRVSLDTLDVVHAAWLPSPALSGEGVSFVPMRALPNGQCAVLTPAALMVLDASGSAHDMLTLTVQRSAPGEVYPPESLRLTMPQIRLENKPPYWDDQEFQLSLVAGTQDADFLLLSTDKDSIVNMMEKGYLQPLTHPELAAFSEELKPGIRSLAANQGVLYAVPIEVTSDAWLHHAHAFKTLGLEAPGDFFSLCDLLMEWPHVEEDRWKPLYSFFGGKEELYMLAYHLFVDYLRLSGQDMDFDTPLFAGMIEKASQVSMEPPPEETMEDGIVTSQSTVLTGTPSLLEFSKYSPSYERPTGEGLFAQTLLDLSAEEGLPAARRGVITLLAVNPRSAHAQQAQEYLAAYVKALPPLQRMQLLEMTPQEIENPRYETEIRGLEEEMDRLKDSMAGMEALEKQQLQPRIDALRESLAYARQNRRFLLTEEDAVAVQERMALITLRDVSQSPEYHPSMLALFRLFVRGGIPWESFLTQSKNILWMIEQESR